MIYLLSNNDIALLNSLPTSSKADLNNITAVSDKSRTADFVFVEICTYDAQTNALIQCTNENYSDLVANGLMIYHDSKSEPVYTSSSLEIKTEKYLKSQGITAGQITVTYKFYRNALSDETMGLFVKTISPNRTEIELPSGLSVLYSYSTPVAVHVPGVGHLKTETRYSVTTSKHISQWLDGNVPARIVPQSEIVRLAAGGFYLTP